MKKYLTPEWPSPANVRAVSTTRLSGNSAVPFCSFNLGDHVGDDPAAVQRNRDALCDELTLPDAPQWLNQVHGSDIRYVDQRCDNAPDADAAWTDQPGRVLSIMTADCLPVLITAKSGVCIAAIHGGWRGLLDEVIQKTVAALPVPPGELLAWLGPAIGPQAFEVGAEVREAFVQKNKGFDCCFVAQPGAEKFLADIFAIGRLCLHHAGITEISGGVHCTFQDQKHFFSYRRDAGSTGRMASLIWLLSDAH